MLTAQVRQAIIHLGQWRAHGAFQQWREATVQSRERRRQLQSALFFWRNTALGAAFYQWREQAESTAEAAGVINGWVT